MSNPFQLQKPREGKHYKFRNQEFYAVEGAVAVENQLTGEFKTLPLRDALLRADAFNRAIDRMQYASEKRELMKCVEDLVECCKEARAQGDVFNPAIARQRARENRPIISGPGCGPPRLPRRSMSAAPSIFVPPTFTLDTPSSTSGLDGLAI